MLRVPRRPPIEGFSGCVGSQKASSNYFFWYRNRARTDYQDQGWKPRRPSTDLIVVLRCDERGSDEGFHQVFMAETKAVQQTAGADTEYERSVFDIWSGHFCKAD